MRRNFRVILALTLLSTCQPEYEVCTVNEVDRSQRDISNKILVPWTQLPILYKIDDTMKHSKKFKKPQIKMIGRALNEIMDKTCVTFQEIQDGEVPDREYLLVTNKEHGCFYSSADRPIKVNLQDVCFYEYGTIVHEMCHALGLVHAQQHPDRDRFIQIKKENIASWARHLFKPLIKGNPAVALDMPYDIASVLHYRPSAFHKRPGLFSIRTKNQLFANTVGQKSGLSDLDIELINRMYCNDNCQTELLKKCLHGGYQDPKNCSRCTCKTGFGDTYCEGVKPSRRENCSRVVEVNKVTSIASPGYPHKSYPIDVECNWYIKVPNNHRVGMKFVNKFAVFAYFHDDICYNWVEVQYKGSLQYTGPRFCGKKTPQVKFVSDGREAMVTLRGHYRQHNYDADRVGFQLKVWPIPNNPVTKQTRPPTPPTTMNPLLQNQGSWFECSFEQTLCGMHQLRDDDFEWKRHNGKTPTKNTGPSEAQQGKFYLYIEATNQIPGDIARIETPPTPKKGIYCVQFYFHMNGRHISRLIVYRKNLSNQFIPIWKKKGNQGNSWFKAYFLTELKAQDRVVFEGQRGMKSSGDIAIDNIRIWKC